MFLWILMSVSKMDGTEASSVAVILAKEAGAIVALRKPNALSLLRHLGRFSMNLEHQ